jgi:hypothetical protein
MRIAKQRNRISMKDLSSARRNFIKILFEYGRYFPGIEPMSDKKVNSAIPFAISLALAVVACISASLVIFALLDTPTACSNSGTIFDSSICGRLVICMGIALISSGMIISVLWRQVVMTSRLGASYEVRKKSAKIEIVSATRLSEKEFWNTSALGSSLQRIKDDQRLTTHIVFNNTRGLPHIYNERINAESDADILVFMHDDVWIDDFFFGDRVFDACNEFDVVGVAGNRRRVDFQPAWIFVDTNFTWDNESNLSGSIGTGPNALLGQVTFFGHVPAKCELLDGVFLAAKKSTLVNNAIVFDPRFDFHLYDMDFCRSARDKGLRLGTWKISLTHLSGGNFDGERFGEKYKVYLQKWGK